MIHMANKHWQIIVDILKKYPYTFYAYGSRVKGEYKNSSDFDICFTESIPFNIQSHIEEDFEESDLPFKVDIIDFNLMNENFRKIISKDLLLIQEKNLL